MTPAASGTTVGPDRSGTPVLVIDAANVVGSVPDGWWRDRAGAAMRLRDRLDRIAGSASNPVAGGPDAGDRVERGVLARDFAAADLRDLAIVLVVEGKARDVPDGTLVRVVRAPASGDDEIVAEVERQVRDGRSVTAVTSDRELRARVASAGAEKVRGAGWLREAMAAAEADMP